MAHHASLCVTVSCDRCHVPALSPDGAPQRWDSLEVALAELSGPRWIARALETLIREWDGLTSDAKRLRDHADTLDSVTALLSQMPA